MRPIASLLVAFVVIVAALAVGGPSMSQQTPPTSKVPAELVPTPGQSEVKPLLDYAESPPARPPSHLELSPVEPLTNELFLDPPARCRPWTRWWWLGNQVDEKEIQRELTLFAEKGFGGVEIQAFSLGDRVDRRPGVRDRILGFDSDGFWANVRAALEAARSAGLGVDLNHGSGWPAGGPWVGLNDTYQTLIYGEASVEGGREIAMALPEPGVPLGFELTLLLERVFGSEVISFPVEHRRLVAVVAARETEASATVRRSGYDANAELVVRDGSETGRFEAIRDAPRNGAGTTAGGATTASGGATGSAAAQAAAPRQPVTLDPSTLRVLDTEVRDGKLRWQVPAGRWRVIAVYAMPGGEAPTLVAAPQPGLVLDHFDAGKVTAHYDHLFGSRTGIDRYWGDPLRGFFNDSLEFKTERHWASGFLDEFARRRGYDLRPWLPALFVAGADNFFVSDVFGVHPEPDFALTTVGADDLGERVRWDYELTVSELVTERFFDASREWAAARGLQSRAQGYGMALDAIGAAGHLDIPETEALYAGGSDLFLKLASSGAHLYGRPLVSAESFVWRGAEYRTTPQKVRAAADKLFTAGINHVIWHGTPYRVAGPEPGAAAVPAGPASPASRPRPASPADDGFGEEGWYPWSIPGATLGFSTNFSEASPFWSDSAEINRYLTRSQALLRQGRPEADVLVYYPFLRFPSSFGNDPEVARREDLFNGWLPEAEPEVPASSLGGLLGGRVESREDPLVPWLRQQQALLQTIEETGLTWEWTNADALESARWRDGGLDIGDGRYGAILLASAPWLPVTTAEAIAKLAEAGAPVLIAGKAPERQPGLFERASADAKVRAAVARIRASGDREIPARDGEAPAQPGEAPGRAGSESGAPVAALRAAVARSTLVELRSSSPAIRHLGRALGDDRAAGAVVLVRNASAESASTELRFPRSPGGPVFFLDAVSGAVRAAEVGAEGWISIDLAPRDSIFLATGGRLVPTPIETWPAEWLLDTHLQHEAQADSASSDKRLAPLPVARWELLVEGPEVDGGRFERGPGPLFDWRDEPRLRLVSSPGRYRTVVELGSIEAGLRYLLDLGRVLHAADVTVNGRSLDPVLFSPFLLDVSAELRPGANTIEVTVRSPLLNRFIAWGDGGVARYARFAGRDPLATGLLGPVVLRTSPR